MASSSAMTVADYLDELPPERRDVIDHVRNLVNSAMPDGYCEGIVHGMIGWVIPLEDYPDTYNGQPLMYAGLAAQKNHYSLYLNCAYASAERRDRLIAAFATAGRQADMGKSCIRFKRLDQLALEAITAEISSVTPAQFISISEEARRSGTC